MEKATYHEHLTRLREAFPGAESITIPQAARFFGETRLSRPRSVVDVHWSRLSISPGGWHRNTEEEAS